MNEETAKKELEEFFETKAPDYEVILLKSRQAYDAVAGFKSEPWHAGLARDNKIYAIDPDVIEEISIHKRASHPIRIKHEMAHLFYNKCAHGEGNPAWLNEGLAYYLANQQKWQLNEKGKFAALNYFSKFDGNIYGPGEFMVRTLIEKFGKAKLLKLIKSIKPDLTEDKFNQHFKKVYGFDFNKDQLKKLID